MGFFKHYSDTPNCKNYGSQPSPIINNYINVQLPPNPNKYKFKIIKEEIINNKSILLVKYFGCTTFNGLKLILLKNKWDKQKSLDPHFLSEEHIVLARFEPNKRGWKLAKQCALISA